MLLVPAHDAGKGLPYDGDHGLVVELCIVEAIEEVDGTRAGCRHADTDLAGELGMRAGHERGHLLVARLHKFRFVIVPSERAEYAVDAVAREAIDAGDSPLLQPRHQGVSNRLRHLDLLSWAFATLGRTAPNASLLLL